MCCPNLSFHHGCWGCRECCSLLAPYASPGACGRSWAGSVAMSWPCWSWRGQALPRVVPSAWEPRQPVMGKAGTTDQQQILRSKVCFG